MRVRPRPGKGQGGRAGRIETGEMPTLDTDAAPPVDRGQFGDWIRSDRPGTHVVWLITQRRPATPRCAVRPVRLFQPELAGQRAGVGGLGGARAGESGWAQVMIVCQRVVCWRVRTSRARSTVALPGFMRRRVRIGQFLRLLKPCPTGARAPGPRLVGVPLGGGELAGPGGFCGPAPDCRERTALYEPLPMCTSPVVAAGSCPPSSGSLLAVALPM
jgi:hypothetical protein